MIIKATHDEMRLMALDYIPKNSTIIEIGCSTGNFAKIIKDMDHKYIGIDIQSDKIDIARKQFPNVDFICCDITDYLYLLKLATTIVSFQCFEHIKDDLSIIKEIPSGVLVILSVPNREYKGHIRWFEKEGWTERFSPYIEIENITTIQHPKKPNNRSFLFKGIKI